MSKWRTAQVAEFCDTGSGGTPSRSDMQRYYDGGTIPWIKSGELRESVILDSEERITEVALRESSAKLVPAGALLLAMYGATVGRLAILGIPATTNQAVCHIVPDPNEADVRYLFHFLLGQVPNLVARGVGGAQPNISQGIIKELKVPLPPLAEQRRIAAILDQADALRAKRRQALAELNTLTQSIFLEMFGDPATNPKRWPKRTIAELARQKANNGIFRKNHEYTERAGSGVPVVWVEELFEGESISVTGSRRLSPTKTDLDNYGLKYGDLLFCRSSLKLDGIAFNNVFLGPDDAALFECHIIRVSPDMDQVSPVFLNTLMRTASMREIAKSKGKTATMTTIDQASLGSISVMLPPLQVQSEFATLKKRIEEEQSTHSHFATELDAFFASLQQRAFRGEL